ncbi:longitudinals lacking protein, isoforms A/B/D/L-like [Halictus rubicundus]|uniref:longitudinals lacking protein, isoforms A/B/D/L-like n=1 Tax=Halictus rubicundus TaxID=77578 RepID=UPI0040354577
MAPHRSKTAYWLYPESGPLPKTNDQRVQRFPCGNCRSVFSRKYNLQYHLKFECGQSPRFNCPYCVYRTRHPSNVRAHVRRIHPGNAVYVVDIRKAEVPQPF